MLAMSRWPPDAVRACRLLWLSHCKCRQPTGVLDRTHRIGRGDILCFATLRNKELRLPRFPVYHRHLRVRHVLMVDNAGDDGTAAYFATQSDVSLLSTPHSDRLSR